MALSLPSRNTDLRENTVLNRCHLFTKRYPVKVCWKITGTSMKISRTGWVDMAKLLSKNCVAEQGREEHSAKNCGGRWEWDIWDAAPANAVVMITPANVWKTSCAAQKLGFILWTTESLERLETWEKHD